MDHPPRLVAVQPTWCRRAVRTPSLWKSPTCVSCKPNPLLPELLQSLPRSRFCATARRPDGRRSARLARGGRLRLAAIATTRGCCAPVVRLGTRGFEDELWRPRLELLESCSDVTGGAS